MGDEDVLNGLRVDAEPAHFLLKALIIVPGVDHYGDAAPAVEEDIRHPFTHTGDIFVYPADVQGLEDLRAPVHFAHFLFLEPGRFLRHALPIIS